MKQIKETVAARTGPLAATSVVGSSNLNNSSLLPIVSALSNEREPFDPRSSFTANMDELSIITQLISIVIDVRCFENICTHEKTVKKILFSFFLLLNLWHAQNILVKRS